MNLFTNLIYIHITLLSEFGNYFKIFLKISMTLSKLVPFNLVPEISLNVLKNILFPLSDHTVLLFFSKPFLTQKLSVLIITSN